MKVCVFGASSDDIRDVYVRETEHLGELMGQNDMDLVFGGGQHGLMGAAARGVRRSNGRVISISPFIFNEDDILFHDFSELYLTRDLIERKQLMLEISDSFVAVPGGIGTIDELFEVYAQSHLGYYRKPLILFNINGYFDRLWQFVCESHEEGFISDDGMLHCRVADSAEEVIRLLKDKNLTW